MSAADFQLFENALKNLIGKTCWSVQAGNVGSLASLQFGEKVPLEKPLPFPNRALTDEEHRFRGEFVLYIEDCPWRMDGTDQVLASWLDSNAPKGPIVRHMKSRIGKVIVDALVSYPGLDLTIRFNDDVALRVFPDQVEPSEGDNYSLIVQQQTFVVAAKSIVYVE